MPHRLSCNTRNGTHSDACNARQLALFNFSRQRQLNNQASGTSTGEDRPCNMLDEKKKKNNLQIERRIVFLRRKQFTIQGWLHGRLHCVSARCHLCTPSKVRKTLCCVSHTLGAPHFTPCHWADWTLAFGRQSKIPLCTEHSKSVDVAIRPASEATRFSARAARRVYSHKQHLETLIANHRMLSAGPSIAQASASPSLRAFPTPFSPLPSSSSHGFLQTSAVAVTFPITLPFPTLVLIAAILGSLDQPPVISTVPSYNVAFRGLYVYALVHRYQPLTS